MDLFKPSGKILEKICENKKKLVHNYLVIPRKFSDKSTEDLVRAYNPALGNFVGEFYNLGLEPMEEFDYSQFLDLFREGITNAIAHGSEKTDKVIYGLFLGDKGICQGFRDFGDYFKLKEIKQKWENKIPIPSTKNSNFSGYGVGDKIIYSLSDFINIDIEKGILYCGQTHERLEIHPGKFYFYEDK